MLRSRQRRLWWIAAAVGALLAMLAALFLVPGARPTPKVLQISLVEPVRSEPAPAWSPPPPPPPRAPQPVPPPPTEPANQGLDHASRLDRADWTGGAVVVCDVRELAPDASTAIIEMEKGLTLQGAVDVVSRIGIVQEGHIWLTVRESSGEVGLTLAPEGAPPRVLGRGVRARLRWSGAEPGETVGCAAVWEVPRATLRVTVTDPAGTPFNGERERGFVLLRGCGLFLPIVQEMQELPIEAGTCTLRVERRNETFPLPFTTSEWVAVRLLPGETLDLTLVAPDAPPLYQPPDLEELRTLADLAAWGGSVAIAEAVQRLLDDLLKGRWSPDSLSELQATMRADMEEEIPLDEIDRDDDWDEDWEQDPMLPSGTRIID